MMEEDTNNLINRLISSFDALTDELSRLNKNVEEYNNLYDGHIDLEDVEFDENTKPN